MVEAPQAGQEEYVIVDSTGAKKGEMRVMSKDLIGRLLFYHTIYYFHHSL
jgi:hypothetical protein